MARIDAILLTCEHGGNRVPAPFRAAFTGQDRRLRGHLAYDEGALDLARSLRRATGAPLVASTVTRLLVDLNRPETDPAVFSSITRGWPASARERLLETLHRPHWRRVFEAVDAVCGRRQTLLHLACHSFTPVWNGRVRRTDVGLLYDPRRGAERDLCARWARALARALPDLRVHRNLPYRGWSPGLTTTLREAWGAARYLGIELELGQRLSADQRRRVHRALIATLLEVGSFPPHRRGT